MIINPISIVRSYWSLTLLSLTLFGCSNHPDANKAPVITPTPIHTNTSPIISQPLPPSLPPATSQTTNPPTEAQSPVDTTTAHTDDIPTLAQVQAQQQQVNKVVILLPDRPTLAEVNQEIEQGIRKAHQFVPINNHLQLIVIHDPLTGEALLDKARAFAPDWIIGPLTKNDIQSINTANPQHILLNRLDTPTPALQIGLPAEDEIDQLLDQCDPSKGQIAIIASPDMTEQRLLTYSEQQAKQRNLALNIIRVEKQFPDIRPWLTQAGGIQDSLTRNQRMTRLTQAKLEDTQPYLRHDIQAVIFLGNAKQLRSIMSTLHYYRPHWKIYATSRILPSKANEPFNEPELNGVHVLVPNYLLQPNTPINTLFEAFGWDSYQLIANPQAVQLNSMIGQWHNTQQQLKRQLIWRTIKQGTFLDTPKQP